MIHHISPAVFSIGLLTLCATATAQGGTEWIEVKAANGPPRRVGAPFAYQPPEHCILMFGGLGSPAGTTWPTGSETWEYDGRNWRLLDPATAPPPRGFTAMAFDGKRNRMVMFGGRQSGVSMNDTWEWDGTTWLERFPLTSPPEQSGHSMAYDADRGQIVLFSADEMLPQTWLYENVEWTLASPAHVPPARSRSALAWDSMRSRIVMFGGHQNSIPMSDTWEWDGTDWKQMMPAHSPPARAEHAMVYDAGRQRTVMFGGITAQKTNDTWEWDGVDWVERMPFTIPEARDGHAMAYDMDRGVVAMYGGSTDTWEYGPTQPGDYATFGQGCPGANGTPDLHAFGGVRPYVGGVLVLEATHLGSGPALLTIGGSRGQWNLLPLPLSLGAMGFPDCTLLTSIDATALLVNNGGSAKVEIAIPMDPNLVGLRFYDQVFEFDKFPNPTTLAVSNGGAGLIGAR